MHFALEMDEFDLKDFSYSCVSTWMGEIMPIHKNLDFGIVSILWKIMALQLSIDKGLDYEGIARTQSPTNKNYTLELPTFGAIVGVSQTEVLWNGLILEEPPS